MFSSSLRRGAHLLPSFAEVLVMAVVGLCKAMSCTCNAGYRTWNEGPSYLLTCCVWNMDVAYWLCRKRRGVTDLSLLLSIERHVIKLHWSPLLWRCKLGLFTSFSCSDGRTTKVHMQKCIC
ncbi:hypothetical protein IQ06DRAFT_121536 [Phaeosphaeriaceae sp. SRC1lsM3a]|nr:hypothetical protein IQ06DRAFT_121536 [Stagonospora sp. SRC1lsM3a]